MRVARKHVLCLWAAALFGVMSADAAVMVSSSGNSGPNALQIPSVLPTSTWTMAYDPATAPTDLGTLTSKGLYTQSAGITSATNMSWANTAAGGIQLLLPHTAGTQAVLGLGALNSAATFDPANVDGSTLGIEKLSLTMVGGQTGTPNDRGQLAFLLVQNGNYYRTAFTSFKNVYSTTPITISMPDLTASAFGQITISRLGSDGGNTNFASNPDFSPSGAPIKLGWLAGYDSSLGTTDANNRSVVTSWSVSVAGVVPEPVSAGILALGLTLMTRKTQRRSSV